MEVIKLQPLFKDKIWGGNKTKELFSYEFSSEHMGEAWVLSVLFNNETVVSSDNFNGCTINEIISRFPQYFGNKIIDHFPALMKIIDARDNLSVQVHPRSTPTYKLGKSECWYIIDCEKNAMIIYGHNAKTLDEFKTYVAHGDWANLLLSMPIKPGSFIYIPSGTVHAITGGTLVFEISQPSDITYRLYDYNRIDDTGALRELHINEALSQISIPHIASLPQQKIINVHNAQITQLIANREFNIKKWDIYGDTKISETWNFATAFVISLVMVLLMTNQYRLVSHLFLQLIVSLLKLVDTFL